MCRRIRQRLDYSSVVWGSRACLSMMQHCPMPPTGHLFGRAHAISIVGGGGGGGVESLVDEGSYVISMSSLWLQAPPKRWCNRCLIYQHVISLIAGGVESLVDEGSYVPDGLVDALGRQPERVQPGVAILYSIFAPTTHEGPNNVSCQPNSCGRDPP